MLIVSPCILYTILLIFSHYWFDSWGSKFYIDERRVDYHLLFCKIHQFLSLCRGNSNTLIGAFIHVCLLLSKSLFDVRWTSKIHDIVWIFNIFLSDSGWKIDIANRLLLLCRFLLWLFLRFHLLNSRFSALSCWIWFYTSLGRVDRDCLIWKRFLGSTKFKDKIKYDYLTTPSLNGFMNESITRRSYFTSSMSLPLIG